MGASSHAALQLWGGIECTVNRVADRYHDQLHYSGHHERLSDLDLIAGLGIKTLRYPLIWERAESSAGLDYSWADQRLARLHALGIDPIVGLLHHGSGPLHTSLVSSCLPEKLAEYAGRLARRYPWLDRYTPVNEPLTTARFSGLYGHWYPHGRDDRTFVRALLNQCRAVACSMAAIRAVNPHAQLVQTEDMGFTRSTDELRYQADFENERRWLSLDLLTGTVTRSHPLYDYLIHAGATARELDQFVANPCPPDVIGVNYYVTSERFLDGRIALYPPSLLGGNGHHRYADVEAVRVCSSGLLGPAPILEAAHRRYNRPIVITEAHLGAEPTQQASWLAYVWRAATHARSLGVDVRAVTAWALLGGYGWDRLVTQGPCSYEPGALSLASGVPEATLLADFIRDLASGQLRPTEPGWWMQDARLLYEPHRSPSRAA
jgi:dTDP-4-dehydrorhamnose reductase